MDNDANEAVKMSILGTVPERKKEFLNLWDYYAVNARKLTMIRVLDL
ncbi:MAG: hypothetical protein J6583_07105 [Gilliamella sp.]|nr:hypothetical protein [Gilliamella sp.]MCO6546135.1 hypothetical protein [Gilliamella sp.]MCO6547528.1 hypothetical protein [Gilliamella sp.]